MDDEEGKGEGSDEDDEAESGFDDPFRDRVVHDRELAWGAKGMIRRLRYKVRVRDRDRVRV